MNGRIERLIPEKLGRMIGLTHQPREGDLPNELSFSQQLALNNMPFPWGVLEPGERKEIGRKRQGILSATSGGINPNPWEIVSEDRARELVETTRGIMSASSGLAGGDLFNPSKTMPR